MFRGQDWSGLVRMTRVWSGGHLRGNVRKRVPANGKGDLVAGGGQLAGHIHFFRFLILRLRAAGLSYTVPINIRTVRSAIFRPGGDFVGTFFVITGSAECGVRN